MANTGGDYDLIVITKGQEGIEAAKEAARLGKTALILNLNPGSIASVMCSTSLNGFPGSSEQIGVEAERLSLIEDRERGVLSFHIQRMETDARHSVFILQGEPEDTHTPEQSAHQSSNSTPSPSETEESSFSAEETATTYQPSANVPDHDSYDSDQMKEILRERELQVRRKLLQRPSLNNRKTKPGPSPSQKTDYHNQEPESRKEMARKYRQPGNKMKDDRLENTSSREFSKSPQQSFPTTRNSKSFKTTKPFEQNTQRRRAIIPNQNHKNKQPSHEENLVRPASNPPQTNPQPRVWEGNGKESVKEKRQLQEKQQHAISEPRKNRKDSSSSLSMNSYQPFQRAKGTPSNKPESVRGSKEAPFTRKERMAPNKDPFPSSYGQGWSNRKSTAGPLSGDKKKNEKPQQTTVSPTPFESNRGGHQPFMNQEAARNVLRNSSQESGLKQDHIEFEDPYGQSYEEFMEPFHNEQDKQLERRKLALRGLHNLINNLG